MGFPNSSGGGASYLDRPYDVTMSQTWDESRLRDYMKRIDPASPWLSRDIVDVKLKNPSGSLQPLR